MLKYEHGRNMIDSIILYWAISKNMNPMKLDDEIAKEQDPSMIADLINTIVTRAMNINKKRNCKLRTQIQELDNQIDDLWKISEDDIDMEAFDKRNELIKERNNLTEIVEYLHCESTLINNLKKAD